MNDNSDHEKTVEQIKQSLLNSLNSCVIGKPSDITEENVKKSIMSVLDQSGLVEIVPPVSVKTRWENMGWKGRLQWRFMKTLFSDRVKEMQNIINIHNSLVYAIIVQNELMEEAGLDFEPPPYDTRDYPNWCHPDPKTVFDVETQIRLNNSIEYVTVDIKV
jgi:hypothetical protein